MHEPLGGPVSKGDQISLEDDVIILALYLLVHDAVVCKQLHTWLDHFFV